jgi:hypothetical protein
VARHPDADVDPSHGGVVYVGFSMGATFGVSVVTADPSRFPRAIMIEGGVTDWSRGRIRRFATSGGKRVLLACGLARRVGQAEPIARAMAAEHLGAKVIFGKNEAGDEYGHGYDGPVADAVGAELGWLLEGDPRWAGVPPGTK